MHPFSPRPRIALYAAILSLALCGFALADPPSRVARLASTSGAISFSPGGEDVWVQAAVNRPLTSGDRVWADAHSRAELQLGDTAIRLGANTSLTLLNLDDRATQLRLAQGRLNLRVRHLDRDEGFEVDTPNLALTIRRPGNYRIEVDPDGGATRVAVRDGQAEVAGDGNAFAMEPGQAALFQGTGLRDYDFLTPPGRDDIDRWASDRDRRWDDSPSARYVPRDLIGYQDLDDNGNWRQVEGYGPVWQPTRVAADWAPYRDGHWAWVAPWGWTWVDAAPWGFAPSHYGRWARIDRDWCWVPGPVAVRPVYAPALVAFVGGNNFQIASRGGGGGAPVGAVGWFALGPHDVYRPSYPVSRDYFGRINHGGTVIAPAQITRIYNTINVTTVNTNVTTITYVNQQVPGAVVAMPRAAFVQSRSVAHEGVTLGSALVASTPVVGVATVAPVHGSVLGPAPIANFAPPPPAVWSRPVVTKTTPPPAPVPFVARQNALANNPGQPPEPATERAAVRAPEAAPIKPVTAPAPVALPPSPALPTRTAQPTIPPSVAPPTPPSAVPPTPPSVVPPTVLPQIAMPPGRHDMPRGQREPNGQEGRPLRPTDIAARPPEFARPAAAQPAPGPVPTVVLAPAAAPAPAVVAARPPQALRPEPQARVEVARPPEVRPPVVAALPRQAEVRPPVAAPPPPVPKPPVPLPPVPLPPMPMPPHPPAAMPAPQPQQQTQAPHAGIEHSRLTPEPARAGERRDNNTANGAKRGGEEPRRRSEGEAARNNP